jgi:tRNA modification GTPase
MAGTNVAMLLTPPGSGAIAVIRIAGPAVAAFLSAHFSQEPRAGRAVHGRLSDGSSVLDDPVVVLGGDGSFADLNLHGGTWIVRSVLDLAEKAGFSLLNPTLPLNERAVDAASPIEAEVLTHLPLATTELALRVLLAQTKAWASPPDPADAERILADQSMHWLLYPPRVAIVGAPNVGKSTLANQLFAQERSITADLPGTTRDWVGELANIDGLAVMLVDTPGQRRTDDPIEAESIARSSKPIQSADLVILVLDRSCPLAPEQAPLLARYPHAIRVINKIDKPPAWDRTTTGIETIATAGQGLDELRRAIQQYFGCLDLEINRMRCWTDRQRQTLRQKMR